MTSKRKLEVQVVITVVLITKYLYHNDILRLSITLRSLDPLTYLHQPFKEIGNMEIGKILCVGLDER